MNELPDWHDVSASVLDGLEAALQARFDRFPTDLLPNESQTEEDLIWPVLKRLGWTAHLRQQNLSPVGRHDVPDGLLFADAAAKDRANRFADEWKRYGHGLAIVESKRWLRPLDRRSGRRGEESAPSTQMLRYLRRIDDVTTGKVRWGILTNGARWRLYWAGARSVSEQFFELDLAAVLGHSADGGDGLPADERRHWLKVFALVFRRDAFLPDAADERTFHERAIAEARYHRERVASSLSAVVFERVFPDLVRALAEADPDAPLDEVRDAALVVLYRLLFVLYAEDRDLLPVRDSRYDDYALRDRVRGDIGRRKDEGDVFSVAAARYWSAFDDLCRAIDQGDASIGLPPYNGGLFDRDGAPMLSGVRLGDAVMADVIDALSFERTPLGRRYINYRDLGVQQLGSIYERLLEREVVREDGNIVVRPNVFARKDSGSYYTPDDLVDLIVREAVGPLVDARMDAFAAEAADLASREVPEDRRMGRLKRLDPAERTLELKVCDPAMGSGHFLVNLVDYVADRVIEAMAEAEAVVEGYLSPLAERIEGIRNTIMDNAEDRGWTFDPGQLDDRHIVRRMVLKRCVYGVDKNPMAVELAKVSLWLHTFTVGAPLSFLDHHLRCGDSLFGAWVEPTIRRTDEQSSLFLRGPLARATRAAAPMQIIEGLTDAEIAEAHRSADIFAEVSEMTAPLHAFMSLLHAFDWLGIPRRGPVKTAFLKWLDGVFGDQIAIAQGEPFDSKDAHLPHLNDALGLAASARFLNWQVAFPGVWSDWEAKELTGGFDAVIGNPPWDRMKLQQVEWFAARRPEIALAPRAADRKRMIAELQKAEDPLAEDFRLASDRAAAGARVARTSGDYPLLARGDLNLYSLFVERAMKLVKPDGMVGLLVPSGIASDKMAAAFFKGVATEGRLKALYDFENKKVFFPDVHASFKFCVFVASPRPLPDAAKCAFYLHAVSEVEDPERCFPLSATDFVRVNPNTGTAPIFRSRRDAELTTAIYDRLPVLVDRSSGEAVKAWPVKYSTMFHMTNDSGLFRTRTELEEKEGAWPVGGNRYQSATGEWVPLYVGRMIHQFDHRAASVHVNEKNLHNPALSTDIGAELKADPNFLPTPQYWVQEKEASRRMGSLGWTVAFRDIARATDARTMIAAAVPAVALGNKVPVLLPVAEGPPSERALLLANLGANVLDFVTRRKVHGTNLNWYIVEQLPIVPPELYRSVRFGAKTAEEIVREILLELTYTAHDLAPFAREMGHVGDHGEVLPPFRWDAERRLSLRAKLDALYFHLYGVTDRDDIRYVYSTFPIIERDEKAAYGDYRSRDLCLAWTSALAVGQPDAEIDL
ncbi:MAG: restriction endonuclease [Gemmatimonadetes bacterium]|nr:restriction endonuclease [Gemmatimonadota bacterium]MYG23334.1 restriction endonuclease [Gemmatimonadota bacterium]MYJ39010.1 restriction endonuclease [Gemmatimonadota bacterium]